MNLQERNIFCHKGSLFHVYMNVKQKTNKSNKNAMKKTILSLLLLIFACSAFGKSANDLIRHYKKMEGAKYENGTKVIKGMTQFMNESDADTFKRIKELESVTVHLDKEQMKDLHDDIMKLKGYQTYYSETNNKYKSFFPLIRIYGREKDGRIKDGIIHIGITDNAGVKSLIVHVTGDLSLQELVDHVELKQGS